MEKLSTWIWTVIVALLALTLGWRAWGVHRANLERQARLTAIEAELEGTRAENRRLAEEIVALDGDPLYLERILRENKMTGPGEGH
jgi:cell division protein FtsB